MEDFNELGTIQIDEEKDYIVFSVNSQIYPLEVIQSAAYVLVDVMFILLDGDPHGTLKIELRRRHPNQKLVDLVDQFNKELLNYSVYKRQSEKNKAIREILLQRALLTNSVEPVKEVVQPSQKDDPEEIFKPHEVKKEVSHELPKHA